MFVCAVRVRAQTGGHAPCGYQTPSLVMLQRHWMDEHPQLATKWGIRAPKPIRPRRFTI